MGRTPADSVTFERRVQEILDTMPDISSGRGTYSEQLERSAQRRELRAQAEKIARDELYGVDYSQDYLNKFDLPETKPNLDTLDNLSSADAATLEAYTGLDLVPGTEYDPTGVSSKDLPYGMSLDPVLDPDQLALGSYRQGIMDLTKSGREDIATLRGQINELDPYQATFTERSFIPDDIDRQSYIDRLSTIAEEDITSRQDIIDELQEKSKSDALGAFLMSFGAGVAV